MAQKMFKWRTGSHPFPRPPAAEIEPVEAVTIRNNYDYILNEG